MFNKLKQFKELKSQADQMKQMLAKEKVEGTAAFSKVKVVMDGNQKVIEVKVDPELLSQNDNLEIALAEAFNDAINKVQKLMMNKLREHGLPGGMSLPGM